MYEERLDAYLTALDDAWYLEVPGWDYAPGFDEWNAQRADVGLPLANFDDYLTAIDIPAGCDYLTW